MKDIATVRKRSRQAARIKRIENLLRGPYTRLLFLDDHFVDVEKEQMVAEYLYMYKAAIQDIQERLSSLAHRVREGDKLLKPSYYDRDDAIPKVLFVNRDIK